MSLLGRLFGSSEPKTTDGGFPEEGIVPERVTAQRDDDFVVFHIGMRINSFWKIHRWLPLLIVAPRMVRELVSDPDSGLLESRTVIGGLREAGFVQYWDSFEKLEAYARDSDRLHRPAWREYYQDGTKDDESVGIWHETYVIDADEYETVYNNMPRTGLGAAHGTEITAAAGTRETAGGRLGHSDGSDSPVGDDAGK